MPDRAVPEAEWQARIDGLFARHRSVGAEGFKGGAYNPGIEGMARLDEVLGHPHRQYPTIHVAGTNGKGTVCSMLAAALASSGLRVGLYTSPHLLDFRERMKIISAGGRVEMVSKAAVCDFLDRFDMEGLSFFEITTGLAFKWFADCGVDAAVIETGLGGRLDSTNVLVPELSVITSIGLDHCDLLGSTRAEIAAEKAGIFKPGVPALVWGRDFETEPVFRDAAVHAGSPLYFAEDFPMPAEPQGPQVPCFGLNLRTAGAALSLLRERFGLDLGDACLQEALLDCARFTGLRARWEVLMEEPLVICDIAHNPPALEANFARLEQLRSASERRRPLLVVFGMMADKDIDSVLSLLPRDAVYFPVVPATPRALCAEDLALKLKSFNFTRPGSVAAGIDAALGSARGLEDPIIYVGGSNYVASEAVKYLQSR